MKELFLSVLTTSLTSSLLLAPLLLLAPRIRSRYTSKTLYFVWLALGVRLALPFSFSLPKAPVTVQVPTYTVHMPVTAPAVNASTAIGAVPAPGLPVVPAPAAVAQPLDTMTLLATVWAVGVAVFLLWNMGAYLMARRRLLKSAEYVGDGVYQSPLVSTPMVIGLFKTVVLAPKGGTDELALRHEFCHLKRGDLWYKTFFLLANALHWFNPLAWLLAREAGRNVELCCDDDVLRNADGTERRAYGELLLNAASGGKYPMLSTRFGGGKKQMKERLQNLFYKKKNSAALVALVLVTALLAGGLVACESKPEGSLADGTYYVMPQTDSLSWKDFDALTELTVSMADLDVETMEYYGIKEERYTLPLDKKVSLSYAGGEMKNVGDFLRWKLLSSYWPMVAKLRVADGTITAMDWVEAKVAQTAEPLSAANGTAPGSIDLNQRIQELLDIICTPGAASAPAAYIDAHREEYDELLSYGEATLNYCGKQFERGAAVDLEGAIMAYLCCDLLGINGQTVADAVTGQYWHTVNGIPYRTDPATGEQTYYIPTGDEEPESTPALSEAERQKKSVEEYKEWLAIADALKAARERYSPLEGRRIGDYYVLAANQRWPDEVISPEPPSAVLMVKEDGEWRVEAWMDSAKVGTTGFSAAVLQAGGMTMVVGDLGEKLARNEDPNDLVSPRYVDIVVDTDQGQYGTNAPGGTYFLLTLDGTLDVTDVHFSEKGEEITSYQKVYGEAPPSGAVKP